MAVGSDADADYISRTQALGSVGQAVWSACGWVYFPSALTAGGIFTLVHSGNGRHITIRNAVPAATVEMLMGDSQTGLTSWSVQPPADTWLFLAIASGTSGGTINAWWSAEGSTDWNNVNRTNGIEGSVAGEIIYLGRTEVGVPDAPVAYFEQWRAFNSTLDLTAFQAQKPLNSPSVGSPILYWPLLTNADTSDATSNSRTPTFNGTLTTQTGPTLGGGGGGTINEEVLTDTLSVGDAMIRSAFRNKLTSDTVSLTDGAFRSRTRGRVAGDVVLVTDQAFRSIVRGKVLSDSLGPTDQLIIRREFNRLLGDAVSVLDSFTASVSSSTIYTSVLTDGIVTVDQLFRDVSRYRQLSDSVVMVDGTLQALQRMRELFDLVEVSDGIVRGRLLSRLVADALDVTDSAIATHVPWVDYRFDARILMGAEPSGIILGVDRSIELGHAPTGVVIGGYN